MGIPPEALTVLLWRSPQHWHGAEDLSHLELLEPLREGSVLCFDIHVRLAIHERQGSVAQVSLPK